MHPCFELATLWKATPGRTRASPVASLLPAELLSVLAFRFVPAADSVLSKPIGGRSIVTVAAPRAFDDRILDFCGQAGEGGISRDVRFHCDSESTCF